MSGWTLTSTSTDPCESVSLTEPNTGFALYSTSARSYCGNNCRRTLTGFAGVASGPPEVGVPGPPVSPNPPDPPVAVGVPGWLKVGATVSVAAGTATEPEGREPT